MRAFEGANDRAATPAERKLLRDLAVRFEPVAEAAHEERPDVPGSGWGWVEAAVWEAVEAGSAFVAPRRLREILLRWEREGFPAPHEPSPATVRIHHAVGDHDRHGRNQESRAPHPYRCRRSSPSKRSGSLTVRCGRQRWPRWRARAASARPIWRRGSARRG